MVYIYKASGSTLFPATIFRSSIGWSYSDVDVPFFQVMLSSFIYCIVLIFPLIRGHGFITGIQGANGKVGNGFNVNVANLASNRANVAVFQGQTGCGGSNIQQGIQTAEAAGLPTAASDGSLSMDWFQLSMCLHIFPAKLTCEKTAVVMVEVLARQPLTRQELETSWFTFIVIDSTLTMTQLQADFNHKELCRRRKRFKQPDDTRHSTWNELHWRLWLNLSLKGPESQQFWIVFRRRFHCIKWSCQWQQHRQPEQPSKQQSTRRRPAGCSEHAVERPECSAERRPEPRKIRQRRSSPFRAKQTRIKRSNVCCSYKCAFA